jgi:aminoglycoside phosphotransferase (APT) family kinase protein
MQPLEPKNQIAWPRELRQYLEVTYGQAPTVERLHGGLSGASVDRLHWPQTTLILKSDVKPAELYFYQHIAPFLRQAQIPIPDAYFTLDDATRWLVMEDIPQPLPRERWRGDAEIATVLARLHQVPVDTIPPMPAGVGYVAGWDDILSEKALACFDEATREVLRPRLAGLCEKSQHLFVRQCAVSGDSNPMNWGVRQDGSAVLFDWERFTIATPAIDLSITVGGLSSRESCRALAGYYLQEYPAYGMPAEQLTDNLLLTKVWVVVEFLSEYTDGNLQPNDTLTMLVDSFQGWVDSLGLG